ncbi:MAG: peptide deformylase [Patescibacteria group bacterium]|nr:peptide deformylase [Patescibacteria group bacterium]
MPVLKIFTHPSAYLRTNSSRVKKKYLEIDEAQRFIDSMIETMHAAKGIGLAAPQVGKNIRIIVAMDGEKPLVFINPKLYRKSLRKVEVEEGCLSLPGVWGMVKRHAALSVSATDRKGKKFRMRAKGGMLPIILQHEVDHLNGILFIDRIKKCSSLPTK